MEYKHERKHLRLLVIRGIQLKMPWESTTNIRNHNKSWPCQMLKRVQRNTVIHLHYWWECEMHSCLFLRKINKQLLYDPPLTVFLRGRKACVHIKICPYVFLAVCYSQKHDNSSLLSINRWKNKHIMLYAHCQIICRKNKQKQKL